MKQALFVNMTERFQILIACNVYKKRATEQILPAKAWCFDLVIIYLSNMLQFKNANIVNDTPAGLTEYNFQTMDMMTLLGGRSRFMRSQRTLTWEAKDSKSGVMFLLECIL